MNQGGYFGQYQGGFQTLPKYAYEMMTAPTQQNAKTIGMVAGGIGGIAQKYMDQKAGDKAFEQGSAAQFKGLETTSEATGVPMNPELANQFKNMGGMNAQQQAAFQQSLAMEAQRMQNLYNIGLQQKQVQQGLYHRDVITRGLNAPFIEPSLPMMQGSQIGMPDVNPLLGGYSQQAPSQSYWNQAMGR